MTKTVFEKAGLTTTATTNHSLQAMGTTQLFTAGIPEKIIEERTGHKSLDALRCYECTTQEQVKVDSIILAPQVVSSTKSFENSFKQLGREQKMSLNTLAKVPKATLSPKYTLEGCKVTIVNKMATSDKESAFKDLAKDNLDLIP
jgi:hypothetical protein